MRLALIAAFGFACAIAAESEGPSEVTIRPSFEDDKPDKVQFGVLAWNLYDTNLVDETWDVDVVITLRWTDPRTSKLLPTEQRGIRLSKRSAQDKMWLPDIAVTNAKKGKNNVISSSVQISPEGEITQVERLFLTLMQGFKTTMFPFDRQDLIVILASQTYMTQELQLQPIDDTSLWGVHTEIFSNSIWSLIGCYQDSFNDTESTLRKSRGRFVITVKRSSSEYWSSIFIPSVIFLVMTWSALWLPLGRPYVMPRVSLNAFALLCQVSLEQKAYTMLPSSGEASWMTMYLELCVELQLLVMLINIFVCSLEHKARGSILETGGSNLASLYNYKLSISYPITVASNIVVLWSGKFWLSRTWIIVVYLGHGAYLIARYSLDGETKSQLPSTHCETPQVIEMSNVLHH